MELEKKVELLADLFEVEPEEIVAEQTELAKSALRQTGMETEFFCALADYLAGRSY